MAWLPSSAETVRTLEFDYLALTVLSMFFLLFLFLLLEQWIYLSCLERWIFIHSFIPAISIAPLRGLYYSEGLPTTARILYRSFTRSSQATAGKGLAQGPYVAARAGVDLTTHRLKVIVSTKAPATTSHNILIRIHKTKLNSFILPAQNQKN